MGWAPDVEAWTAWEFKKTLPHRGGVLDQPLALMVRILAISTVYHTWKNFRKRDFDWSKFTVTQRAILKWLEGDE